MSAIPIPDSGSLAAEERETLTRVADALCGGDSEVPPPSALAEYGTWLDRAIAARADARRAVLDAALDLSELRGAELRSALRELAGADYEAFHALSSVVAGAYLLVPEVCAAIGYPGQERAPARFDEAAEQLETGILEPVLERGSICREAESF